MPSPSTSLATHRPDLAASFMEFDLEMNQRGFIAQRVLPVFETDKAAGPFGKISVEQLLQTKSTERAPGADYGRGNWQFTTDTFATQEHGWEEPIDDNEALMYREYFDAEQVSTSRAFNIVLQNQEMRAAAAIFNATTWASYTAAVTTEWSTVATAVPMTDVETAVQAVWAQCGRWPNSLIINRKVFRNLRRCAQIIDLCKAQGFQDVRPGNVTQAQMATVFDLENVIVAGTAKNTANQGQDAVFAPIWSDEYAMVCCTARSNDIREPCVGRTFHWAEDGSQVGGTIETYRDEKVRGDVVRVRHQTQEKLLYVQAGYLLSNITA